MDRKKDMSDDHKTIFNTVFKGVLMVCATLVSIIFYSMKDDLKTIGSDVTIIKVQMMHVEDRVGTHADAINELKVDVKNLEILKADK